LSRTFYVNGETMVTVKSSTFSLSQLGLAEAPIAVSMDFRHKDVVLDAWGSEIPADVQFKLAACNIQMTLIHFDPAVLDQCLQNSMATTTAIGTTGRAGTLMGGGVGRFVAGNYYIGLNLASPVFGKPWRFFYAYLTQQPMTFPLGTEKSITTLNWRAVPYTTDPWGGGTGALGAQLWDYNADN